MALQVRCRSNGIRSGGGGGGGGGHQGSSRARVLAGKTGANGTAGHAALVALTILFEAHGLSAAAAVLVRDAGDGGEGAGHGSGPDGGGHWRGGAVLRVKSIRVTFQNHIDSRIPGSGIVRPVFARNTSARGAASSSGSEALTVPT